MKRTLILIGSSVVLALIAIAAPQANALSYIPPVTATPPNCSYYGNTGSCFNYGYYQPTYGYNQNYYGNCGTGCGNNYYTGCGTNCGYGYNNYSYNTPYYNNSYTTRPYYPSYAQPSYYGSVINTGGYNYPYYQPRPRISKPKVTVNIRYNVETPYMPYGQNYGW